MNQDKLREYARLLIQTGVNLQDKQTLVVSVDVEQKDFAVIITEEAYDLGAKEVVINWRHSPITRQRLLHADASCLETPANWIPVFYQQYVDEKAAFLSLISANPNALQGIPTNRISLNSRNLNKALTFYHTAIMNSTLTWCVASVPTVLCASLLVYTGTDEEKIERLENPVIRKKAVEKSPSFFSVGDICYEPFGNKVTVTKINQKTVSIIYEGGFKETIKPHLLSR